MAGNLLEFIGQDREDKFIGLIGDFGDGPVAEFELAFPSFEIVKMYGGRTRTELRTHFRADLKSVRQRAANLSLPKNYGKVPWTLVQERAAEQAILAAMAA